VTFAADRDAPVFAEGTITIAAPRAVVWQVLTELEGWPAWNPGVKSLTLTGPLAIGATFKWKAGPGTIRSKIEELDPPTTIGWTGRTFGIRARHAWQLIDVPGDEGDAEGGEGGTTTVTTQESWRGPVPAILRGSLAHTLQGATDDGLRALRDEALKRV
jgi:carbon monoxide dehydrogenase subunit G